MAEDDWALRAQAATQREEIQLLRGAVAALRATRAGALASARDDHGEPRAASRYAVAVALAFALGVLLTAAALAIYRVALCP